MDPLPIVPVKFGGSIVTDKGGDKGISRGRIRAVARAVAAAREATSASLVVILGGGSIGHRSAVAYGLAAGVPELDRLHRMARAMFLLKCTLARALESAGVPTMPFHEGSLLLAEGEGARLQPLAIRRAIELGVVPILSGGPVYDSSGTMVAFNSDRLGHALLDSGGFALERFILVSDAPGVVGRDGAVIPLLTPDRLADVADIPLGAGVIDVSGGMAEKVAIASDLARRGVESVICGVEALAPERFPGIVAGKDRLGTLIPAAGRSPAGPG
jgi:isopentenyl phosphate kinase